jgi:hypothetical protein
MLEGLPVLIAPAFEASRLSPSATSCCFDEWVLAGQARSLGCDSKTCSHFASSMPASSNLRSSPAHRHSELLAVSVVGYVARASFDIALVHTHKVEEDGWSVMVV